MTNEEVLANLIWNNGGPDRNEVIEAVLNDLEKYHWLKRDFENLKKRNDELVEKVNYYKDRCDTLEILMNQIAKQVNECCSFIKRDY